VLDYSLSFNPFSIISIKDIVGITAYLFTLYKTFFIFSFSFGSNLVLATSVIYLIALIKSIGSILIFLPY